MVLGATVYQAAHVLYRWYALALGKGRISVGDSLTVTRWRDSFADYGKESRKVSTSSASFIGSPEWVASIVIIALAAAFYTYAMHAHFWGL